MVLLSAGSDLIWQQWNEVYIVYQPSSAETHVFNETTALILRSLEPGPLSSDRVLDCVESCLGIAQGDLGTEGFAFAVWRLEELGLIEC